jgi:hypothetical protein
MNLTSQESPNFAPQGHAAGQAAAEGQPVAMLGRDQRKSSRQAVPSSRQTCELKVGANLISAVVVNESQGGFAVLASSLEGLKIGKKAQLHTDAGWFTVRVVYVNKVAAPKKTDRDCDSWFRLGLKKAGFSLF